MVNKMKNCNNKTYVCKKPEIQDFFPIAFYDTWPIHSFFSTVIDRMKYYYGGMALLSVNRLVTNI